MKREKEAGVVWPRKQGWGKSGKYSPAQVAVHGFHIIVLAARKGAQLVEGHSWGERSHTACSHNTHPKLPGPTKVSTRELLGVRGGLAGV